MALILGAAVPSIRGILREQQALEPLTELADMVRTTRDRAIRLQRPYQIVLDTDGCFASAFLPRYGRTLTYPDLKAEVDALRQEMELAQASAARFGVDPAGYAVETAGKPAVPPDDGEFLLHQAWPAGYQVSVRFWKDPQWETLEGARSKLWVIQPTGLSTPVQVRFDAEGVSAEGRFDPLTGELASLHSSVR